MNLDKFIFKGNQITVPNICELELNNDICIVHKIFIEFNKYALFFKILKFICTYYHSNICIINDDPCYNYNGVKIDASFYYYKHYTKNPFIINNFCLYDQKQTYDIYNYDMVYSVGSEQFKAYKTTFETYRKKKMIEFILHLQSNPDVKEIKLLTNFNVLFTDIFKDRQLLQKVNKFFKINNIINYNYVKILN